MREIKYRLDLTHNYLKIDAGKEFYLRPNDDNTQKIFMLPQSYTINCRRLLLRETCLTPQWYLDLLYYVDDSDTRSDNDIIEDVFKFSTFDVSMDSDNVSTSGQIVFVEGVNGDAPWFNGVFEKLDSVITVLGETQLGLSSFRQHFDKYNVETSFWDGVNSHRVTSDAYVSHGRYIGFAELTRKIVAVNMSTGTFAHNMISSHRYELVSSGNTQISEFVYASFPRGASIYCANGFQFDDLFSGGNLRGNLRLVPFKQLVCCYANSKRYLFVADDLQLENQSGDIYFYGHNAFWTVLTNAELESCRISY